jgi:replicative DNA helicase
VDHIGLVEAEGGTANERLGLVSRSLKKLAKRLEIPIIACSQLNRRSAVENRKPQLADLRDSGNIEQDADVAIFLHSDDESENGPTRIEIGVLKSRYGRKGWLPQRFEFDGRTQRFCEVP